MRKHGKIIGIVIALVAVVALVGGWTAFAQSPTATPPAQKPLGGRGGFMRGGLGQVGLEAAAKVLGMTAEELSNQLWGGRTLADLAEKAGVDLQKVRDAVDATHKAAIRAEIEQAVKDGKLTRENADWLLIGLDKGYLPGLGGRGFMGGPGRFGGLRGKFGGFGAPQSNPAAQPQKSS